MTRKILEIAVVVVGAMLAACTDRPKGITGTDTAATGDEEVSVIVNDTASLPMFLMANDGDYKIMVYWTDLEKPAKSSIEGEWFDQISIGWVIQDMFRRNREQYTNLIVGDSIVKMRFVDEVFKDPDGNPPSIGDLFDHEGFAMPSARFTAAEETGRAADEGFVIVTDSYLQSRKLLTVRRFNDQGENVKQMPADILSQLEQHYGMKVSRSVLTATIRGYDANRGDSTTWSFGAVQFKGEYKNAPKDPDNPDHKAALALDVLTDGNRIYVNEEIGFYFSDHDLGWNVDDEGEFIPCAIAAAFEGPHGLELCYAHFAPESCAIGLFLQSCSAPTGSDGSLQSEATGATGSTGASETTGTAGASQGPSAAIGGNRLINVKYANYYSRIGEERPMWNRDLVLMDSLYHDDERSEADVRLTKWAYCYMDDDNEWIWLRDNEGQNGAFFLRNRGKLTLIGVENHTYRPSACHDKGKTYLMLDGPAGGPGWVREIHIIEGGVETGVFCSLEAYGEIDECSLNGKDLTKKQGQAFLSKIPEGHEIEAYFRSIAP